jgi:hypothetical protein
MTTFVFIESDGNQPAVSAADGASPLSAAVGNDVADILADCGGGRSGVTDVWGFPVLSCQITLTPNLDGWSSRRLRHRSNARK